MLGLPFTNIRFDFDYFTIEEKNSLTCQKYIIIHFWYINNVLASFE